MRLAKRLVTPLLVVAVALSVLVGCKAQQPVPSTPEIPPEVAFTPSYGIDESGFWQGVEALAYVELPVYRGIPVPASVHVIPDSIVEEQLRSILEPFAVDRIVMTREIRDGDRVNIDYVGSIDGKPFDGGSTGGMGTNVKIGSTDYIEGFLEQLVGRSPGQSFDIEVRFPDDYGIDELAGADAVFAITVNYIVEADLPELTDAFVATMLFSQFGASTVEGLTSHVRTGISRTAVVRFVQQHVVDSSSIASIPAVMLDYQEELIIDEYKRYAAHYGMPFAEFIQFFLFVSSTDELLEMHNEESIANARVHLVLQAVAEDAGLKVDEADVRDYFLRYIGTDDYREYADYFGMPYIKMVVLQQKVVDFLADQAKLE